jgi:hypothetical protein
MPEKVLIEAAQTHSKVSTGDMTVRRSPDFRTIYSNNSGFGINPFDFSFTLNEVTQDEKGEPFIEQKIRVIMPPLHAKLFALLLRQNLKNYENQFGEIKIPGSIIAEPRKTDQASDTSDQAAQKSEGK